MTDNPCNCSDCPNIQCKFNPINEPQLKQEGIYFIWDAIIELGCLSHPKAQEYLNAGVIQELERIKKRDHQSYDPYDDGKDVGFEMGCDRAIALIRGVK